MSSIIFPTSKQVNSDSLPDEKAKTLSHHPVSSLTFYNGFLFLGVPGSNTPITHVVDASSLDKKIKSTNGKVQQVTQTPDGRIFSCSVSEKTTSIYRVNPENGEADSHLINLYCDKQEAPRSIKANNEMLFLTSPHVIHIVRIDKTEEERVGRIVRLPANSQEAVAIGPESVFVAASVNSRAVAIYEYSLDKLQDPKLLSIGEPSTNEPSVSAMLYHKDRLWVASGSQLLIWDPKKQKFEAKLSNKRICALTIRDDVIYAGKSDGSIDRWDTSTCEHLDTLRLTKKAITCLATNENYLAIGTKSGASLFRV